MTEESRKGWRKAIISAGAVFGACTAIIVFVERMGIEVPRPAWSGELEALRDLNIDTRNMVLTDRWFQTHERLQVIRRQLDRDPDNPALIQLQTQLERQLRGIEDQQRLLDEMRRDD